MQQRGKKVTNKKWWMIILGVVIFSMGITFGYLYTTDANMFMAVIAVICLLGGGSLLYLGMQKPGEKQQQIMKQSGIPQEVNCISILAKRDTEKGKDIPLVIKFHRSLRPKGTSHYIVNTKEQLFINFNNTSKKKMMPAQLPDKGYASPAVFPIHSNMPRYREYMEYTPPTMMQKVAPGILLVAIIIVGIIMVATGPSGGV